MLTHVSEACDALPGFQPTLNGGDGNGVQFCEYYFSHGAVYGSDYALVFVGYWPGSKSVVVAHEGTDPTQM